MRSPSPADLGSRLLGLLPVAATATAEGAWIAVVYAAIAIQVGLGGRPEAIGVWTFVTAAAAGMLVARRVRGRLAPPAILASVALAALGGWAMDPAARDLVAGGAYDRALTGGSGWMLGLAVWRGSRHADSASDDLVVGSLLTWAVPGLAIPWLIGTAMTARQAFIDVALPATLLFVAAGLVAVGLTRLEALGRAVGVDWRRNRTWLALLVGVVGLMVAVGTPIAFLLGTSVEAIGRTILGPLGGILAALAAVLGPIGDGIGRFVGTLVGPGPASPPAVIAPGGPPEPAVPGWAGTAIAAALGVALLAGGLALRRLTRGDRRAVAWRPPKAEERRIALPVFAIRLPTVRLPRPALARRVAPTTASEAYLTLLHRLEDDELRARAPAESPAGHARRLRALDHGSLSLDLLAADFELERYAGFKLTRAELGRAIARGRADLHSLRPRRSRT